MFQHSVKVPRHYKIAANILKKVSTEGGSVKTLLYDDKLRHFRTNVLYALISEAIKHSAHIDRLFENTSLLTKEPRLDPWLAKILTTELLFGKKHLPGASKPEQTILTYKEQFDTFTANNQDTLKTEVVGRPRYVRINTNLLTTSDAIGEFQDESYRFVRCTSGSYNDYLEQIKGLSEYDFTQDYHVKTMFVFAQGTKFHDHPLYLENKIILQDKATAMAVHLLAPPPGSVVLDMCAAPGMKTTQLAAYMRNQGKIYAVERNEKRYQTLCDFVEKTGSMCVETLNKDCLEIKRGECEDVEYILLDPSCTGSGMSLSVHNYIEDERMARLTSLQEKFLKHAMNSFPNAKKIVYSTCSLFPEENERVITNMVMASRAKWSCLDIKELLKGQWNNFGSGMYGNIGTRCLYAKPESDSTTGFFLAVLERKKKSDRQEKEECNDAEDKASEPVKKKTKGAVSNEFEENGYTEEFNNESEVSKKKKKKKSKECSNSDDIQEKEKQECNGVDDKGSESVKKRNKYNSVSNSEVEMDEYIEKVNNASETTEIGKKKKKKKSKESLNSDEIQNFSQDANEVDETINKVKKNKKRKQETDEVLKEQPVEEIQFNTDNTPKKKKNKKHTKNNEIDNAEEIEKSVEPKKKMKKHAIEL